MRFNLAVNEILQFCGQISFKDPLYNFIKFSVTPKYRAAVGTNIKGSAFKINLQSNFIHCTASVSFLEHNLNIRDAGTA